jgi:hypothetical protein
MLTTTNKQTSKQTNKNSWYTTCQLWNLLCHNQCLMLGVYQNMMWENNLNIMFELSMHTGMILLVDFHLWLWDCFQFSWHFNAQTHNNYFKKQILLLVWIEYVVKSFECASHTRKNGQVDTHENVRENFVCWFFWNVPLTSNIYFNA